VAAYDYCFPALLSNTCFSIGSLQSMLFHLMIVARGLYLVMLNVVVLNVAAPAEAFLSTMFSKQQQVTSV
jgi:hypothetical protein